MKRAKKLLALALALVMSTAVLTGCGEKKEEAPAAPAASASTSAAVSAPAEMIDLPTSGQNVVQTAVPLIAGEQMGTWE